MAYRFEHHSDSKIAAQSAAHHLKTWILNAEVGNASKQGRYDYEALHCRNESSIRRHIILLQNTII